MVFEACFALSQRRCSGDGGADDGHLGYRRLRSHRSDLRARHSTEMRGITVPAERAASMIDEYPVLSVVAAFAKGRTHFEGVGELRVKESDRIAAMVDGLRRNGVEVEVTEDTMSVHVS